MAEFYPTVFLEDDPKMLRPGSVLWRTGTGALPFQSPGFL